MGRLWKSKVIGRAMKVNIFTCNMKAVLPVLHASESWTVTQRTLGRLQVFINTYLQRITNIHWPDRISTKKLWKKTGKEPVLEQ